MNRWIGNGGYLNDNGWGRGDSHVDEGSRRYSRDGELHSEEERKKTML